MILKLGTKEVLFSTRHVGWGGDTDLYRSLDELTRRFPSWLRARGRAVLKQGRGNGGNGVWKVELLDSKASQGPEISVRVRDARLRDGSSETTSLGAFMNRCAEYFEWSGCLVAQGFQDRLVEGMVRCYLCHDEVVGFVHQWPRGLLDAEHIGAAPASSAGVGHDDPAYQRLRDQMEREWLPKMIGVLGIERESLPVIWDADFLYGPRTSAADDTYVLCEINVSAVWPFPPVAAATVAAAAVARTSESRSRRAPVPG